MFRPLTDHLQVDGLLKAETCSWLAVTISRYIYIYSCVLTFKCLLFNFMILTNTTGMSHLKVIIPKFIEG